MRKVCTAELKLQEVHGMVKLPEIFFGGCLTPNVLT